MGFPYGLDEDAAFMITWLELNKFEGIKKLAEISINFNQYFKEKINLDDVKSKQSINLRKTSLLRNGPSLFDYLYEKTKKNQKLEVSLENCIDPIFIIPLAGKLSKKLISLNVCWLDENKKKILINVTKNKILIGETKNNLKIFDKQVLLQFSNKKNRKNSWKKNLAINNIKRKINFSIEQKHLEESLKPNLKHWKTLSKLAKLTFVPASVKSRDKGAGGGDDND